MEPRTVKVIGGGLAGSEVVYQIASSGLHVDLYEMTPAHHTDHFALK